MPNPLVLRLVVYFAPVALVWAWLTFAYTPRYVTETRFVLRNQQDASLAIGASAILGGGPEQQDLHMIREFVLSPNLLAILDKNLDLRVAYSSPDILPPQRLSTHASFEDLLDAYRDKIDVEIDATSSIMTLRIEGFEPAFLLRQTELMLAEAEGHVNNAFRHIAERQARAASETLDQARKEREAAAGRLLAFQREHQTFRPDLDGEATQTALTALETTLAEEKARASSLEAYLGSDSPLREESRARIEAIQKQILAERSRLVPPDAPKGGSAAFNRLLADYQLLQLNLDLATQRYAASLEGLQRAQLAASESLKSLVVISAPFLPTEPSYPRTGVWVLLVAFLNLFASGPIIRMLTPPERKKKKNR